ncbi:MAG: hypothetical protein K0S78_4123, partial [Thermomicrobiales bacterium]|nr:hypothetical protein [Thermomicrobiales bacterium]
MSAIVAPIDAPINGEDGEGRYGGMTAEVDLDGGREPAQRQIDPRLVARAHETGLRLPQLAGDALHLIAAQTVRGGNDAGGVAGEWSIGEGIDQGKGNHRSTSSIRDSHASAKRVDAIQHLRGGENLGVDVAQDP